MRGEGIFEAAPPRPLPRPTLPREGDVNCMPSLGGLGEGNRNPEVIFDTFLISTFPGESVAIRLRSRGHWLCQCFIDS